MKSEFFFKATLFKGKLLFLKHIPKLLVTEKVAVLKIFRQMFSYVVQ